MFFFFSEGPPNDNGLKLSHNKDLLLPIVEKHFDNISYYTPSILKQMGYEYYVKERNTELVSKNPGMSKIGNSAWKPLILLLELQKMNEGDILLYRDCNLSKYKNLTYYDNIRDIIDLCLQKANFDFFISREKESPKFKLKYWCKTNVIKELGENHKFVYEFPLCVCNLLIVRKSKISIELLNEWKLACEKEEWIDGKKYGNLYKDFKWSTSEQAILNVILANWIRKRKYNIPIKYPSVILKNRDIYKIIPSPEYDYIKYLNNIQVKNNKLLINKYNN